MCPRDTANCPCGLIEEADEMTQLFVWALRRWLDGVSGQNEVWCHLAARMGAKEAHRALGTFENFLTALAYGARRPFKRGLPGCPLLRPDEATLGRLLQVAAEGDHAAALASTERLVNAGAEEIAVLARELGAAFMDVEPPFAAPIAAAAPMPPIIAGNRTLH